jgi:hypothetical protein
MFTLLLAVGWLLILVLFILKTPTIDEQELSSELVSWMTNGTNLHYYNRLFN